MRLLDLGYKEHFRVKHSANEFSKSGNPNNGIENFWGLCKVRLAKFRGIKKDMFYLHLKECKFKYNCRLKTSNQTHKNIYKKLLKMIRNNPINFT